MTQVDPDVPLQAASCQIHIHHGIVRPGPCMAAVHTAVSSHMAVIHIGIFHRFLAHRAVGAVMVDPHGMVPGNTTPVHPEPPYPAPSPGQTAGKRIVPVQQQFRFRPDGGMDGCIDLLRVAVAGKLVPAQVRNHQPGRTDVGENTGRIPLIHLHEQHLRLHPASQGGMGQHQGSNPLYLVGSLLITDHCKPCCSAQGCRHLHRGTLTS